MEAQLGAKLPEWKVDVLTAATRTHLKNQAEINQALARVKAMSHLAEVDDREAKKERASSQIEQFLDNEDEMKARTSSAIAQANAALSQQASVVERDGY